MVWILVGLSCGGWVFSQLRSTLDQGLEKATRSGQRSAPARAKSRAARRDGIGCVRCLRL